MITVLDDVLPEERPHSRALFNNYGQMDMAEPTVFERPYTGAYDDAVLAFAVAHPAPGPTYEEIKRLLFPEPPPVAQCECAQPRQRSSSSSSVSSHEPSGGYLLGLPLGIALGMMF